MERKKYPRAVVAVLIQRDGKYLLTRETLDSGDEKWIVPGGGVEWGETIREAAIREIKEGFGLDIQIIDTLGYRESVFPQFNYHAIIFFFLGAIVSGHLQIEACIKEARYFTPQEVRRLKLVASAESICKETGILH